MKSTLLAALAATFFQAAAMAHEAPPLPPGVTAITLSAQAQSEVDNDEMRAVLFASRDGARAEQITREVLAALSRAAERARKIKGVEIRMGGATTSPAWGSKGKTDNWTARGSIVLTSRDISALSALVPALLDDLMIESVSFNLSRQARAKAEDALMQELADNLHTKASAVVKSFGYASYEIRTLQINHGGGGIVQPMRLSMAKSAEAAPAMPSDPGKSTVAISVNAGIEVKK